MIKEKLIELLRIFYDDGFEDGLTSGKHGVSTNDFDDSLFENKDEINKLIEES